MTSSAHLTTQGVWVVGATFGAWYARALKGYGLSAIVGQGGETGRQIARELACDYFSSLEQALAHSHPACAVVAVRSSIIGGEGDNIARRLLQAGVPVLQELPVHPQEVVNTLRIAKQQGVFFTVTPFYDQMPTVRRFLRAASRLSALSPVRSVEMRVSVQTLHCALFILSDIVGAPSPLISATPMAAQEKILIGSTWQGVAVDIVVMNRFDAASPDDNSQPLMQITLLSDEGELTLHSPFGQVIWERRLQPPEPTWVTKDIQDGIEDETLLLTSPLSNEPGSVHLRRDMETAIRATLRRFIAAKEVDAARLQRQLAVLKLWQAICMSGGHPQQCRLTPPRAIGIQLGLADREEEI